MKFFFDLFPILLFFIAFKIWGIFVATAVAIGAAVLQIVWVLTRRQRVDPMLWVNLGIISVFGGATLFFHNELFIKWKPTVLYALLAGTLLLSKWIWNKNLLQTIMGTKLFLPTEAWTKLNFAWAGFFLVLGAFNIVIAYTCSTPTWVTFKLFGSTVGMIIFIIAQSIWLAKYVRQNPDSFKQKNYES